MMAKLLLFVKGYDEYVVITEEDDRARWIEFTESGYDLKAIADLKNDQLTPFPTERPLA
jgi:hypothetical protein